MHMLDDPDALEHFVETLNEQLAKFAATVVDITADELERMLPTLILLPETREQLREAVAGRLNKPYG